MTLLRFMQVTVAICFLVCFLAVSFISCNGKSTPEIKNHQVLIGKDSDITFYKDLKMGLCFAKCGEATACIPCEALKPFEDGTLKSSTTNTYVKIGVSSGSYGNVTFYKYLRIGMCFCGSNGLSYIPCDSLRIFDIIKEENHD